MFRAEVATFQRDRLSGDVAIAVPVSWQAIGYLLFGALALALVFLALAPYARVETAAGTITPDTGVAPIVPTRAGVITDLAVTDGQMVAAGTTLATIRSEEDGRTAQAPGALVEAAIARQDASLALQASAALAAAQAQASQLSAQQAGLAAEIQQLRVQMDAQQRLITSAEADLARAREIAKRGFISARDLQVREEALLSRQQGLAQLEQAMAAKRAALTDSERGAAQIAAQARAQSASLAASRAQVAQQAASTAAARAYVLRAPVAGRVTALTARIGQPAATGTQLMVIVPKAARLTAQLAVPSAAIGFIKPGQEVRVALDAFPYQRFGTVPGRVATVATSAVNAPGPNGSTIAVYPVVVALSDTAITAFGKREPLVPGMSLTARIITDQQSLLEWLFEPLFAVAKR
ncbi:MAG: HlyD family efflux transporter periplasmic adaptor subunit [Porphyrobacter sp.]|nr:HlyD family efflux transporter periplasmic adaptor subunit [Porphyrobacter sp.]